MTIGISRLDSVSPRLGKSIREASRTKQRQAVAEACATAAFHVGLTEPKAQEAIELLRRGEQGDGALRARLEAMAADFDNRYLDLQEEGGSVNAEALRLFSKARAVAAMAFALSGDSAQLQEAVYEAIAAVDDPAKVIESVEQALR